MTQSSDEDASDSVRTFATFEWSHADVLTAIHKYTSRRSVEIDSNQLLHRTSPPDLLAPMAYHCH